MRFYGTVDEDSKDNCDWISLLHFVIGYEGQRVK